ncbi:MAG: hypothetical protein GOV15_01825, partial [Candidatus Diapherotrites archaeon]|nr:hypothetical protein [Candidatus Diapherotrites archaeon]
MLKDVKLFNDLVATVEGALVYKDSLVFSDVHLGMERVAVSRGVYLPKKQFADCLRRLTSLRKRFPSLKRVVIAGDLKHEHGRPSSQEWNEVRKLLDWLVET